MAGTGALREGQTARRCRQIRGYSCHKPLYNTRIPVFKALRDCASQQEAASDRPLRAGILMLAIPGRAKRSSLRQLAVSPNSRAEPSIVPSVHLIGGLLLGDGRRCTTAVRTRVLWEHLSKRIERVGVRSFDGLEVACSS